LKLKIIKKISNSVIFTVMKNLVSEFEESFKGTVVVNDVNTIACSIILTPNALFILEIA
jgi:hypothetical protein